MKRLFFSALALLPPVALRSAPVDGLFKQGDFARLRRFAFMVTNYLDQTRQKCLVVVQQQLFPGRDLPDLKMTAANPLLPLRLEPTEDRLAHYGVHEVRAEPNGRMLHHQFDDLDQDGLWDELFLVVDLAPCERRTIDVYPRHSFRSRN